MQTPIRVRPNAQLVFKFVAGQTALDFNNTVAWRRGTERRDALPEYDRLRSYALLAEWAVAAQLLSGDMHGLLLREAAQQPKTADDVLQRAVTLREAIHWLFVDVAADRSIEEDDLYVLNDELHRALSSVRVAQVNPGERSFVSAWSDQPALDQVLRPVAQSAADLLTSADLEKVRECAGDPCGFLFLDTSPKGNRRWCVMEECGNREKARRHYHRRKVR